MPDSFRQVYLNTAGCGLISESLRQAGIAFYERFEQDSSAASEEWRALRYPEIKRNAARLMRTEAGNVAFLPNFSFGINALVHSLKGNEKVLLYRNDFPSLYLPFVPNKFDITWIDSEEGFRIDIEKIAAIIKAQKIDVVVLSHVQWQSGFKIDLAQLGAVCHDNNALLIVDATQSLGAIDIDLSTLPVDVLMASNYKWMNAGFGTGLMYMHPAFLDRYPPMVGGNAGTRFHWDNNTLESIPSVTDYEPGSPDMFSLTIMSHAIEEKLARGLLQIEERNMQLTQVLLDQLIALPVRLTGDRDTLSRASIVCIDAAPGLHDFLALRNIITTCRHGLIRISIHMHNTESDIRAITDAIGDWGKTQ
ncbi:aminotransferase class V-fold PLP-dependent enzyme [Taibaiella koreensis]|uniref:aminotransferase class V-fold PLP-dependent enzyme n=1 Tax=Taibaiella koreensis TaxID=1268548 RepID=UPI000E59DFAB|nr:aminotransferase class V-fold PLP-dependent enzyme [Taibaiella koreensis]